MDKMREEFSKRCQLWRYSEEVDENDFFVNATTQRAWDIWVAAWQASRQALVVELPPQWDDVCDKVMDSTMVKQSLNDAGIKWTE